MELSENKADGRLLHFRKGRMAAPDPALDDKRREQIKIKVAQLDNMFIRSDNVSEKVLMMEIMAVMRGEKDRLRTKVDLTYPINPPYGFCNIKFNRRSGEFEYNVQEPSLKENEHSDILLIKNKMEATMDQEEIPLTDGGNALKRSPQLVDYVKRRFDDVTELFDIDIPEKRRIVIQYYLERDLLGLGIADPVFKDPFIEDISCNGPGIPLFVFHRVFGSMRTNIQFRNEIELNKFVIKLAQISGKHVSIYSPILDATLSDGSRINLTLGSEVTKKGSTFTVRKFSYDPISPIDLIRFGTITPHLMAFFWMLIENKKSILVSGGTASGKTTLMNALCMFIKPEDKIVSIEDTPEIQIDHTNWIQSISRAGYGLSSSASMPSGIGNSGSKPGSVTLFDLLVAALRQRPEYIIVGEVRGQEAVTLFQAISVGHASLGTIHAASIDELMHRVENEPMNIPRVLFQALDAVVFQGQVQYNGRRVRRVKTITEIIEIEPTSKDLLTNNAYTWDPKNDSFPFSGRSYVIEQIAKESGKRIADLFSEMERRENYLKMIDHRNITYYKDVSHAINMYYVDPDAAIEEIESRRCQT
ncbi:MAG: type II/IV secretion system ATPase subunit [Methanomassiliicoccales archaeon]